MRGMYRHVALAIAIPVRYLGDQAEEIASAPDLATLADRVRALAPGAKLRIFERPSFVLIDGRPIAGIATGDPGRTIFLCCPALVIRDNDLEGIAREMAAHTPRHLHQALLEVRRALG